MYIFFCSPVSSAYIVFSIFSGNSFKTSFFIRLSINGFILALKLSAVILSPSFTSGISYLFLNSCAEYKYPGITKSNIDHNSSNEFSIGVPVRANLCSAFIFLTLLAFIVFGFLICCASSIKQYENSNSL